MKVRPKLKERLLAVSALGGSVVAAAGSAFAQAAEPAQSDPSPDLQEVVVTGSRRATTLLDAPINITAVTQQSLQNERIDSIQKLVGYVPGLAMVDLGPRSQGALVVRGLASSENRPVNTQNDTVATYLGEVPLFQDFKLLDIDRVEVLLGPQGTLYGRGTLAGAVRYIPKRPDMEQFGVEAHARFYDVGHAQDPGGSVDATLNIPLVSGKLAFRTVLGRYDDPGFIDAPYQVNTVGVSNPQPNLNDPAAVAANLHRARDINDEKTWTTRNSLLFRPYEGLDMTLSYAYQVTNSNGRQVNAAGVLGTGFYENGTRVLEPMHRSAHLPGLELNADLGFAKLVSATAVSRQTFDYVRDATDELLNFEFGYEEFPSFTAYSRQINKIRNFNQEVRLISNDESRVTWVLGGFYRKQKTRSQYYEFAPGLPEFFGVDRPDNIEFAARSQTSTTENAGFGELGYKVTDAWQVTGGLRYFSYDAYVRGGSAVPLIDSSVYPDIDYSDQDAKSKDSGTIYKLNTSYKFSADTTAYVTYSTGYRIGGVNNIAPCPDPLPTSGQVICALPNEVSFGPDRTKNSEIGVRTSFFDRRLSGSLALFHIDWSDLQLNNLTQNGAVGYTTNASRARSRGIELSFSARPADRFNITGSFSYTDARLTEDAAGIVQGSEPAFAGDRLPLTPRYSGSLSASYAQPLANNAQLITDVGATYRGDTLSTLGLRAGGEKTDPYTLVQAAVTYRQASWEAGLYADNIFDVKKIIGVNNTDGARLGVVNDFTLRGYGYYVTRPRVLGVEVRFRM